MKPNEMIVLSLAIFIAIVVSVLWTEHQHVPIANAQGRAPSETHKKPATVVIGFAGALCTKNA